MTVSADVLVVGAGPSGAAVAATLARHGHAVVLVDRAVRPVGKACGELLTPRAVAAVAALGLEPDALGFHPVTHVRLTTASHSSSTRWPGHDDYPDHGLVAPRERLDQI